MNSDYYRRKVDGHQKKIAELQKKRATESGKAADLRAKAAKARASAAKTKSMSYINSYLRQAETHEKNALDAEKKAADAENNIAKEYQAISRAQEGLNRAERDEAQKQRREADKQRQEYERRTRDAEQRMRNMGSRLSSHDALHRETLEQLERLQRLPERITVLFMASNPLDQTQLRLDEEVRAIEEKIRASKHRDAVKLESRWAVRSGDILQAMNEFKPAIVHFSGHGSDQDELVLQTDQGGTKLVAKEAIVSAMAVGSDTLQLVFFNTCYSRNQAEAVVEHIPAAIGMSTTIGDEAARVFAAQFYSAIGFGLSARKAFDQAKAALMLESIPEEDTPELFIQDGLDANEIIIVKPPEVDRA